MLTLEVSSLLAYILDIQRKHLPEPVFCQCKSGYCSMGMGWMPGLAWAWMRWLRWFVCSVVRLVFRLVNRMFLIIASLPQIKYAWCVRVSFVCVPAMQIDYSSCRPRTDRYRYQSQSQYTHTRKCEAFAGLSWIMNEICFFCHCELFFFYQTASQAVLWRISVHKYRIL